MSRRQGAGGAMTWPRVPLSRLVHIVGGGTPSKSRAEFWSGSTPWVSPKDMNVREIVDTTDHISAAAVEQSATQVVPAGSILIVIRSGILAHTFPVAIARRPLAINQDMKALVPRECLCPEFLAYALESASRVVLTSCVKFGATVHSVDMGKLKSLEIPLPSLSEQRRIVEILDQADRLRRLRAEADARADRLLPAVLTRILGSPTSWPGGRRSRRLGELVNLISGATPSKENADYWDGEVPWVSPKDMKQDFLSDSQDHISETALNETNLKLIDPGNVLIVVRGMILARDVPVAMNLERVTINQDMKALVPKTDEVTGSFLWAALRLAKTSVHALVRTAAHGTRKLDTPELMQFEVVVPSATQRAQVQSAVDEHRRRLLSRANSATKIGRLFAILLSRAFSGSLTAAWRQAHMKELLQAMREQAKALGEV